MRVLLSGAAGSSHLVTWETKATRKKSTTYPVLGRDGMVTLFRQVYRPLVQATKCGTSSA